MPLEIVTKGTRTWRTLREEFVEAQAGICAICRLPMTEETGIHLDHDHASGFIRGALCTSCNTKLGWYEAQRRGIEDYLYQSSLHQAYQCAPRLSVPARQRKRWQDKATAQDLAFAHSRVRAPKARIVSTLADSCSELTDYDLDTTLADSA